MAETTDAELVARILAGSRDEYTVVVERYQEKLYRHALGMVQDPDAAADLVQDSFVKAYAGLARCQDPERFRPWLFSILRNRCTDYLREHRRRDVPLEADAQHPSTYPRPEQDLERSEIRDAVELALAGLPEAQREVFLLKHVEDLSYEEISGMLGVGVSALKMRVARAREALRASLRGLGYDRGPTM